MTRHVALGGNHGSGTRARPRCLELENYGSEPVRLTSITEAEKKK
jgi:hypothetical protein